jgi:hypothetical protein
MIKHLTCAYAAISEVVERIKKIRATIIDSEILDDKMIRIYYTKHYHK